MDVHECGTTKDDDDDNLIEFKDKNEMKIQYPAWDQEGDND